MNQNVSTSETFEPFCKVLYVKYLLTSLPSLFLLITQNVSTDTALLW